jgi:predicted small secreted protein
MKNHFHKIVLSLLLSFLSISFLSGCNTVAGAGKDTQAVGRGVQRAANSY